MRLYSAPMGDYKIKVSIDSGIEDRFKHFEIDPYAVADLAEAMGVVGAIERRLETNVKAQRSLDINYLGKELYRHGREVQGLAYSPGRSRRGKYQPAYLQVSPVSVLKSLLKDDRYSRKNPSPLTIDEKLERSIEATTKHEISHFVDDTYDALHNPDLSRRQMQKIRKSIDKEQKMAASNHPLVKAKERKLIELLPDNRFLARTKSEYGIIMEEFLEKAGKIIGLNIRPESLSIGGLASTIKWYKTYYLKPTEILARTDAMLFEDIGRFCCAELKKE